MISKNINFFIEVYLVVCLILGFIVIYNYIKQIIDDGNKLLFNFIIAPLFGALTLGIFLYTFDFKFIEQYITVCGPILSAFVAIYVSYSNDKRQKDKESGKKLDHFEFNIGILNICQEAMELELENYQKLIETFQQDKVESPSLSSAPFNFLELFISAPQHEVFAAFIETNKLERETLKEIYLAISKNISSAIFIKQKAEQSYKSYMEMYNLCANKLFESQKVMNLIYRNACNVNYGTNQNFCKEYSNFIAVFHRKCINNEISFYSLKDLENEVVVPIKRILDISDETLQVVNDLASVYENLYSTLVKLQELRESLIRHFSGYRDSLWRVFDVIKSKSSLLM